MADDDIIRGGLDIVTEKKNKPKAEQETAQPTAARFNKTFKKRKNRAFLTLLRSQKHYVIFSNNVLQENITRKQFNRWLGVVSISQTALRYLQPRSKGIWERG